MLITRPLLIQFYKILRKVETLIEVRFSTPCIHVEYVSVNLAVQLVSESSIRLLFLA